MEAIKKEFDDFLNELVKSYPKATTTVLNNPSTLSDVGAKSRDFSMKAKNKIAELASKHKINQAALTIELSSIQVNYHSILVEGHL